MTSRKPIIFDIRRGSMDDGPGIRSTVFFKGCPLACIWCHNPESISREAEILFTRQRCLGDDCGACGAVCRGGRGEAGRAVGPGVAACCACGECAAVCPGGARRETGRSYPLDELCAILLKDLIYYRTSRGGVTLSGGEPTLHHDYVVQLLWRMKKEEIHTALQTCGQFPIEPFCREILPLLDMVYFDLKLIDPYLHHRYTGCHNGTILADLCALAIRAPERLTVRVPLVPGITTTEENLTTTARLLTELGIDSWELLPYNPGGIAKRKRLAMEVPADVPESFMAPDEELVLLERFRNRLAL